MAQRKAKDIEEKEEARRHKKAQPVYDQRKQAAAPEDSRAGPAEAVLNLQQSYGNRYVQRVIGRVQAKLIVNPPDDQYEREADRVADAVTGAPASSVQRQAGEEEEISTKRAYDIQRQPVEEEEEETIQAKPEDYTRLQRQAEEEEEEEEEPIQTKLSEDQPQMVAEGLEAGINAARGGGQLLPNSVRSSLEPQFGHDFSQVHIHTNAEANRLSQQLGAEAFTTGNDVFFREGAYQPGSDSGRRLITHELTHVVQQGAARVSRQAAETEGAPADPKEKAKSELTKAVSNIAGGALEQEYIKILLRSVQACQILGLGEDTWRWALDEAARVAVDVLKAKIATLDVESSDPRIIEGLVRAVEKVQELGEEEGAVETAWKNAFDVAMDQLTGAVRMLKATPTEAAALTVTIKLINLMLLGGADKPEATEASKLLTVWREGSGWAA